MRVTKIVRTGKYHSGCRVSGLEKNAVIPNSILDKEFSDDDFVFYQRTPMREGSYYYKSISPVKGRKRKVSRIHERVDNFSAERDIMCIRKWVMFHKKYLPYIRYSKHDIVSNIYLSCWETGAFEKYNPKTCTYDTYISAIVENHLISMVRSKNVLKEYNKCFDIDDRNTYFFDEAELVSNYDIDNRLVFNQLEQFALSLDDEYPICYSDCFKVLTGEKTVTDLNNETGVGSVMIREAIKTLKQYLLGYCESVGIQYA